MALITDPDNLSRRVHRTLRATPAMRAGVTPRVWDLPELADAALELA